MDAWKCDRCGEYYDKGKGNFIKVFDDGCHNTIMTGDLCPRCSETLLLWLNDTEYRDTVGKE